MVNDNKSELSLIKFLRENKENRIYILSGKNSYNLSGAKSFFDRYLSKHKKKIYFKTQKYPKIEELKKIILDIKNFDPKIIIAVGGGSVIDYAKIANNLNNIDKLKLDILNSKNKFNKIAELVAIPTTAGSGAEITSSAVIYINKIKYSVEGNQMIPDHFFLIPKFILKNKRNLKSSSGFDAISQSIESLISMRSNNTSVMFAKKSLKISLKYFLPYLKKPSFLNSNKMLIASNLSGKAIAISKTTAPHAVSYPLTSHFGISHGDAVSITLEDFLLFNYLNIHKSNANFNLKSRYNILFNLTNSNNIFDLIKYIKNIKTLAKTESSFNKLNLKKEILIPKVLNEVNIKRLSNNPVPLDTDAIKFIFETKF